jgi:hypothetical protein
MTAGLLVAMFKVHLQYGFSSIKLIAVTATGATFGPVGYEVVLLYIACLAALVSGGSGPFAIDGLLRKRFEARASISRVPATAGGDEALGLSCRQRGKHSPPRAGATDSYHPH